jgi:hypothetical protein
MSEYCVACVPYTSLLFLSFRTTFLPLGYPSFKLLNETKDNVLVRPLSEIYRIFSMLWPKNLRLFCDVLSTV